MPAVLDVVIGLVYVFLLLSLVVTALNEAIAAAIKRRAKTLWRGVVQLVGNDKTTADKIFGHPLIKGMTDQPLFWKSRPSLKVRPSYIPSRTFVLALLDTLSPATPGHTPEQAAAALKTAIENQTDDLSRQLKLLLADGGDDIEKFKKRLEEWFDASMERVSGWYKKRTQWIVMLIALVVTVVANADTLAIMKTLWSDPGVRSALVAQAQQYVEERNRLDQADQVKRAQQAKPGNQEAKDKQGAKVQRVSEVVEPPDRLPFDPDEQAYRAALADLQSAMNKLENSGLPLGWRDANENADQEDSTDRRDVYPQSWDEKMDQLAKHWFGWILTTLAISLGAPFWFDMLKKVMTIRNSGQNPKEEKQAA